MSGGLSDDLVAQWLRSEGRWTPEVYARLSAEQQRRGGSGAGAAPLSQLAIDTGVISPAELQSLISKIGHSAQRLATASPLGGAPSAAPPPSATVRVPGAGERRLGRYRIERELGRGGMGVVYLAHDPELSRQVAIKQLLANTGTSKEVLRRQQARFALEGRATAKLNHPHVVAVFEVGDSESGPFLVMEYVKGKDLELAYQEQPPLERVVEWIRQVASALGHAHAMGLIHRDIKPANVLIDEQGRARLTDFGLARDQAEDEGLSRTGAILGTPLFLSPEQARGKRELGPPADVFGLGGVLYLGLTGAYPFPGENLGDLLGRIAHEEPVAPRRLAPQVPRDLETIVLKCLEKAPGARYADGEQLALDLARFQAREEVLARPVGRLGRALRWARRSPALAAASGAALVLGAVTLGGGAYSYRSVTQALGKAEARAEEARLSRAAALEEKGRAEAAADEARRAGRDLLDAREQERLARSRAEARTEEGRGHLARSLAQRGVLASGNSMHNRAAALLAASLELREDPQVRGLLVRSLAHLKQLRVTLPPPEIVSLRRARGLVVGFNDGLAHLRGTPKAKSGGSALRFAYLRKAGSGLAAMAVGPEQRFAMADRKGTVALFKGAQLAHSEAFAGRRIVALEYGQRGRVFVAFHDGEVASFSPSSKGVEAVAQLDAALTCMAVHPQSEQVLLGTRDGTVALSSDGELKVRRLHEGWVTDLRVQSDGSGYVSAGVDGKVIALDREARGVASLQLAAPASGVTVAADGQVWIGTWGGEILRWWPREGAEASVEGRDLGRVLAVEVLGGSLHFVEAGQLTLLVDGKKRHGSAAASAAQVFALDPSGKALGVARPLGFVDWVSIPDFPAYRSFRMLTGLPTSVALEGEQWVFGDSRGSLVWGTRDVDRSTKNKVGAQPLTAVSVHPRLPMLAAGDALGRATLIYFTGHKKSRLLELGTFPGPVHEVHFYGGKERFRVAASFGDGRVRRWKIGWSKKSLSVTPVKTALRCDGPLAPGLGEDGLYLGRGRSVVSVSESALDRPGFRANAPIRALYSNGSGKRLLLRDDEGNLVLLDGERQEPLAALALGRHPRPRSSLGGDDQAMVVGRHDEGTIAVWGDSPWQPPWVPLPRSADPQRCQPDGLGGTYGVYQDGRLFYAAPGVRTKVREHDLGTIQRIECDPKGGRAIFLGQKGALVWQVDGREPEVHGPTRGGYDGGLFWDDEVYFLFAKSPRGKPSFSVQNLQSESISSKSAEPPRQVERAMGVWSPLVFDLSPRREFAMIWGKVFVRASWGLPLEEGQIGSLKISSSLKFTEQAPSGVAVPPSGEVLYLAAPLRERLAASQRNNHVLLRVSPKGDQREVLWRGDLPLSDLSCSGNGKWLLACGPGRLLIFALPSGRLRAEIPFPSEGRERPLTARWASRTGNQVRVLERSRGGYSYWDLTQLGLYEEAKDLVERVWQATSLEVAEGVAVYAWDRQRLALTRALDQALARHKERPQAAAGSASPSPSPSPR